MRTDIAKVSLENVIERMIKKIENGETRSWFKPWKGTLPTNFLTKKEYRGFNVMMLWFMAEEVNYMSNDWLTFKQVKQLKGRVKKGEKSTPIFFYKPLKIKDKGTEEEKTIPMLKMYSVFNVEQCENLKIEEAQENTINDDIEFFIVNIGATIKEDTEAFYNPTMDYIGMPTFNKFVNEDHYYSTLLHELSHWTGSETRLERDLTGRFGDESYAFEELIAESSAALLGAKLGIKHDEMRHEEYLESWIKVLKAEPEILWKVFSQSQKVYDFLLEFQEEAQQAA